MLRSARHENRVPSVTSSLETEFSAVGGTLDNTEILRGVLAGCGDCIKILDLDGRLQFMSEGGKRVMEVEDFSKLKGCPWPDFWAEEGNTNAKAAVAAALTGKSARFQGAANTAKGNPRYWDVQVSPILDAAGKPTHILSISKDITAEAKAAERQSFLMAELQHRVKNMLGVVQAIARQTFRGDEMRTPREAFSARVSALDSAHKLLDSADWRQASVQTIVEGALQHLPDKAAIHIEGPEVQLGPQQAMALALATNELATNAIKYGALRDGNGRVAVTWRVTPDNFEWSWRESGGAPVAAPTRTGFGTRVIKNLLAEEMSGSSEITYEPGGLVCKLTAPRDQLLVQ